MNKLLVLIMGFCFALNVSFAQGPHRGEHHKKHPKLSKEAKDELMKFQKETVYPVKKAAHDKFLAGLNQEDRTFLEVKRTEEKALRKEMHTLKKEVHALKKSRKNREEIREQMKAKFEPIKEKFKAFKESMKPFMERNQSLIKAATGEMKNHREDWKNQKMAILDKYLTEEQKTKMEAHKAKRGERHSKKGAHVKGEGRHKKGMGAIKFVLWDGELKVRKDCKDKNCTKKESNTKGNEGSSASKMMNTQASFGASNYPNPAITQTTILLELPNAVTKVKITIADAQGKQVWTKQYNKLNAGEHKVDVNLRKFTNGQYFYTVEIGEEQLTKTLVVNQ